MARAAPEATAASTPPSLEDASAVATATAAAAHHAALPPTSSSRITAATATATASSDAPAAANASDADVTRDAERHEHQLRAQQLRTVAMRVPRPSPTADAPAHSSASSTTASRKPPLSKPSQPPVAKKPGAKRRRRDLVDVEWDQALVHFANCMQLEFQELNAEFVAIDDITFTSWKALWTRRRMSAAFHVEFWESTPSSTHQTILQTALELIVCCIEDHSPFEESKAVASLFGFVFALFSAYSVQLGTPKHKIDVDPRAWTALMVIGGTCTTGLGSLVYPKASSEVLAMLSALVHKENAFLKCLRGFGHQFRGKSGRAAAAEARAKASEQRRVISESGLAASDLETLLKEEQVAQLDMLSKQYSDSVALIDATSASGPGASASASSLKLRANRLGLKHAPVSELTQSYEKSRLELLAKLRAYLDAKASVAASRMLETQDLSILELKSRQLDADRAVRENGESVAVMADDDEEDFHFEYDHEELVLPDVPQPSGSSSRPRSHAITTAASQQSIAATSKARRTDRRATRSSIASSEHDSLALFEEELSRDVYNVPAPSPPKEPPSRKRQRRSSVASTGSALTFTSDAASDGLAELQAELNASLSVGRDVKPIGIARCAIARVEEDDSESFSDSAEDSEYEESDDGLAELEAELEAEVGAEKTMAKPKPKAKVAVKATKQPARKPAAVVRQSSSALAVAAPAPASGSRVGAGKRKRLLDAVSSVTTASDDGLAELQAELEFSLAPPESGAVQAKKPTKVRAPRATTKKPKPAKQQTPNEEASVKKSTRGIAMKCVSNSSSRSMNVLDVVSIATESDDGALAELQAELELSTQQVPAVASQPLPKVAKRSNKVSTSMQKATDKAPETGVASAGIAPRGIVMRRMRAASIATESDDGALAELQTELERTVDKPKSSPLVAVATKPVKSTRANLKRAAPTEEVNDENGDVVALPAEPERSVPATSAKSPVKPPRATRAQAQGKTRVPSAEILASPRGIAAAKRRKVSDAVSIATTVSDDDDDSLAELQAELERSVEAAEPAPVVETEIASATTPKRKTRRADSSNAEPPTEVPSTRQSARTRSVPSEKEPELATTTTAPAIRTTRSRSSVEPTITKPAKQSTTAAAHKTPTVTPAALGKPPTGKATKKMVAAVVKKAMPSKPKKKKGGSASSKPTAPSQQAEVSDAPAIATATQSTKQRELHQEETVSERASTRLRAKSVSLSVAKASIGTIGTSDDDDESDDGLGELEAELQASIASTTGRESFRTMGNLKRASAAAVDSRGPKYEPASAEELEADGGWWRVLLLRGLVQGDLQVVEKQVLDHIEALAAPFTNAMAPWKLQWESTHWWLLKDATPLCVASMYSHPELVKWLLLNGADRSTPCYLKQTALDFLGECCEHSSMRMMTKPQTTSRSLEARSAECRKLLLEAPSLPYPPGENVTLSSTFSSEVVLVRSPTATPIAATRGTSNSNSKPGPGGDPSARKAIMTPLTVTASTATTLQQKIFKCVVHITWQTSLSNGAIIDKYEVRYRIIVVDEDGENATAGGSGSGADSSSESWRLERATHNRRTREQKILLVGLQFATLYEFTIRSWNAVGKGEWGRNYKLKTRESSELASSS